MKDQQVSLINQPALAVDALELGYLFHFDLIDVLEELLSQTTPETYTGHRPPQKSYEQEIKNIEMFAFVVTIKRFPEPVYYKFALEQGILWLVSLHRDRKK